MLVDRELRVHQSLALPAPPGYVIVIPKYIPAPEGGPWRLSSIRYKRVLDNYSATGTRRAARRAYLQLWSDPLYGAPVPLLSIADTLYLCDPRESLREAVAHASGSLEVMLSRVVEELVRGGVDYGCIGVTGTLALGMAVEGVSDIDLVVYGVEGAEAMLGAFKLLGGVRVYPPRRVVGGLAIDPPAELWWRRKFVHGVSISWIGAPTRPGEHCTPLRAWRSLEPPEGVVRAELFIEPGQASALVYPPCVESREGLYIMSYEYNVAYHLYKGGRVAVKGLKAGSTVLLGAQEEPGYLRIIDRA